MELSIFNSNIFIISKSDGFFAIQCTDLLHASAQNLQLDFLSRSRYFTFCFSKANSLEALWPSSIIVHKNICFGNVRGNLSFRLCAGIHDFYCELL